MKTFISELNGPVTVRAFLTEDPQIDSNGQIVASGWHLVVEQIDGNSASVLRVVWEETLEEIERQLKPWISNPHWVQTEGDS